MKVGCVLLIVILGITQCYSQEIKKTAVCFEDERRPVEVYLHCSPTERIYVLKTQHGLQNQTTNDIQAGCAYKEAGEDACASLLADVLLMENQCMGRHECQALMESTRLNGCGRPSNYFQVAYKCLAENSADDSSKFADICGDSTEGQTFARTSGYIESMNYPDEYAADVMCTCKLKAARPDARIYLKLLDYDLQSDKPRNYDWLEYTTDLDMWGNDRTITLMDKTYELNTHSREINLNFRTDGRYETGRGFWLEYEAKTDNGQEAEIHVQCQPFQPSYEKKKFLCLENSGPAGEFSLTCGSLGVINIIYAQTGHWNSSCESYMYQHWHNCAEDVSQMPAILQCMGEKSCVVPVLPTLLPNCSLRSNYWQVHYECIEDTDENKVTTDVCGDQLAYGSLEQQVGYIKSLDYPNEYSDSTRCYCRLETTANHASIQITVLDMSLEPGSGTHSSCQSDWVEYVSDHQDWGRGHKLCEQLTGEPIHTDRKIVFLNFQTDGKDRSGEGRGFWIKYAGKTTDKTPATVRVICSTYDEDRIVVVPTATDGGGLGKGADDDDDDDSNGGKNSALIVGLVAIVALMLVVVIGLAAVKYTRASSRARNQEENAETPLDTSFNSMKRTYSAFSSRNTPYTPFKNNPSLTASLKSFTTQETSSTGAGASEPTPDYNDDVLYSRGGYHGNSQAYVNRSYGGALGEGEANPTSYHTQRII